MSTLTLRKKATTVPTTITSTTLKAAPAPFDADHFYFLWRLNGKRPTQRHPTIEAAITERDRLMGEYPGAQFLIFEAKRINE